MPSEKLEAILNKNPKAKAEMQQARDSLKQQGTSGYQQPNSSDHMKLEKPDTKVPQNQQKNTNDRPGPQRGVNVKSPQSVSNPNPKPKPEPKKENPTVKQARDQAARPKEAPAQQPKKQSKLAQWNQKRQEKKAAKVAAKNEKAQQGKQQASSAPKQGSRAVAKHQAKSQNPPAPKTPTPSKGKER